MKSSRRRYDELRRARYTAIERALLYVDARATFMIELLHTLRSVAIRRVATRYYCASERAMFGRDNILSTP